MSSAHACKTASSIDPQVLLNNFTDFNIKYAGLIPEIPLEMDPTGRTDILKEIDRAKRERHLPRVISTEHDAVLRLNAYSIRIVDRRTGELLLCAPVHQIAAVCFVQEDDLNILGIKIGEVGNNKDISDLAVLYCSSENLATEMCNLIEQSFQLVFTDAAMQYYDKRLVEGVTTDIHFMNDVAPSSSSADHPYGTLEGPSFISGSRTDLNRIQPSRPPPQSSTGQSDSENFSVTPADLIQEYMIILQEMLSPEENSLFALLLKRWRDGNLPLAEYCQKVLELFGPHRKHLLARMRPFMQKDQSYFETFLEQSGITENAESTFPNHSPMSEFSEDQCMNDSMSEVSVSSTVKVSQPTAAAQQHDATVLNNIGPATTIIHFNEVPMTDVTPSRTKLSVGVGVANKGRGNSPMATTGCDSPNALDNVTVFDGSEGARVGVSSTAMQQMTQAGDVSIHLSNPAVGDSVSIQPTHGRPHRYNKHHQPAQHAPVLQRVVASTSGSRQASGSTGAVRGGNKDSRSIEVDMATLKVGFSSRD